MPAEALVVTAIMVAVFVVFAGALAWASTR